MSFVPQRAHTSRSINTWTIILFNEAQLPIAGCQGRDECWSVVGEIMENLTNRDDVQVIVCLNRSSLIRREDLSKKYL